MEIKDTVRIAITDLAADGRGIGRAEGIAVFVPEAVPGDEVQAEILALKKNHAEGRVTGYLKRSPGRAASYCPYAGSCGGCALYALSYDAQLKLKERQVRDKLMRIAGLEEPELKPILRLTEEELDLDTAGRPLRYRNKAVFSVGRDDKGLPLVGFKAAGSHRVIDVEDCFLQTEAAMACADVIRSALREGLLQPYDEKSGKGILRGVTVKTAFQTGEVMVVLDLAGAFREVADVVTAFDAEELVYALEDRVAALGTQEGGDHPWHLESVIVNSEEVKVRKNVKHTGRKQPSAPGKRYSFTLAGKRTVRDSLCGLTFEIAGESFYQVDPLQAEKLYEQALNYAGLGAGTEMTETRKPGSRAGDGAVLDLYCGVGTIGLIAAARGAGQVYGIESVREAVLDANRNAVINGIVNARFLCGKAEEALPDLLIEENDENTIESGSNVNLEIRKYIQWDEDSKPLKVGTVILDPPRRGCETELLDAVCAAAPERIVYVSCDPATLARDLRYLGEHGYRFVEATPCDMFPNTMHIETVVQLSKGNISSQNIRVEFSLEDMDMSRFQQGATYEQIQNWVQEKYGFHVTHLNIAKTKRKCGIIERQNYNLPKSEDSRSPETPKEKEEAIIEAFRHLGMI
ncbi:MAG: class I SAM-dependent RNA methyltransferase [Clostridia bacterium]|nr:class I SAM-dependent RNA methyltransferase [Clostridia bacterium]